MNDVRLHWVGKIISGHDAGWFVKVVDAGKEPDEDYLILIANTNIFDPKKAPPGSQGFDNWVENWQDVEWYFDKSNWVIEWLMYEPPQPPNP